MKYEVEIAGRTLQIDLEQSEDLIKATINDRLYEAALLNPEENVYTLLIDGRVFEFTVEPGVDANSLTVYNRDQILIANIIDRKRRHHGSEKSASGAQTIRAPMPGRVVQIMKAAGETVNSGEGVIVIEAMKMQNELGAPKTGKIVAIKVTPGQTVTTNQELAIVE
jgi:biotin carboxyl carrier protein